MGRRGKVRWFVCGRVSQPGRKFVCYTKCSTFWKLSVSRQLRRERRLQDEPTRVPGGWRGSSSPRTDRRCPSHTTRGFEASSSPLASILSRAFSLLNAQISPPTTSIRRECPAIQYGSRILLERQRRVPRLQVLHERAEFRLLPASWACVCCLQAHTQWLVRSEKH